MNQERLSAFVAWLIQAYSDAPSGSVTDPMSLAEMAAWAAKKIASGDLEPE